MAMDSSNPEFEYKVTITDEFVRVYHPDQKTQEISWAAVKKISLVNTGDGPFLPDVWLTLSGDDAICSIPQGSPGYDEVYEIVSKYPGFDFNNVINSMLSTGKEEFSLWTKS